jgi:hypothetical protein
VRTFASSVSALLIGVMLLMSGGAWSPAAESRVQVELDAAAAADAWLANLPPEPAPVEVRPIPVGCSIPRLGATCPSTAVAGGLDVPRTVDDLVPDEVTSVGDWRPLVSAFFDPVDVDRALQVIWCESKGDPLAENPRSTASGLFQHLASLWEERTIQAGMEGADIFDPVDNVALAAWLVYDFGGWSHWAASSVCW